jgi:hypothetical protein
MVFSEGYEWGVFTSSVPIGISYISTEDDVIKGLPILRLGVVIN